VLASAPSVAGVRFLKTFFVIAASLAGLFALGIALALTLVASPLPPLPVPKDVFDFTSMRKAPTQIDLPSLRRYPARDGEELAYRFYESTAERILIFIHGSSYHGSGYHALAEAISLGGAAKVVLPNLRGHYQSGLRRGDVDYIGQLEDDLDDLIKFLRRDGKTGPVTLGGHSSGGGLAIRFAGGTHARDISSYLLMAPIIPRSPAVRGGTAGGWANLHLRRIYGLVALNAIGITGFNGLTTVEFNKPAKIWDGTETLAYSYRLNVSYHPRASYAADLHALADRTLVLVGADDQALDPFALNKLIVANAPRADMKIMPGISHFGVFSDPAALDLAVNWLRGGPESGRQ
jgi:non-heme chloroperoxidase